MRRPTCNYLHVDSAVPVNVSAGTNPAYFLDSLKLTYDLGLGCSLA